MAGRTSIVTLPLQMEAAASEAAKAAELHQLDAAVVGAVRAAGGAPAAAPVWLAALEAMTAAGAQLDGLLDQLTAACLGQRKGPIRVSVLCQSMRVRKRQLMAQALEAACHCCRPFADASAVMCCTGRHGVCGGCGCGGRTRCRRHRGCSLAVAAAGEGSAIRRGAVPRSCAGRNSGDRCV